MDRRLAGRGFSDEERSQALERLRRTGLVDDARFARSRAESLAARGAGDDSIRRALGDAGIDSDTVEQAVAVLEPEAVRALHIVTRRGASPKTARYLYTRGFTAEVVTEAIAASAAEELP